MLSAFTLWLHYMTFLESQNHETNINSKGTFIKTWYISKKKKICIYYYYIYIFFRHYYALQPCHKCNLIVILFFPLIFYWLLSNCEALGIVLEPCGPLMSQSMPYFTIYNTRYKCLHFFSPAVFIVPFFSTVSPHLRLACPVYLCLCPCLSVSVSVYVCVRSRLRARPFYSTL